MPDVSYNAAVSTGVLVVWSDRGTPGNIYLFGGTSAGSPQWAALLAISNQRAGYDLGFINQGLYRIGARRSRYGASFYDVKSGDNSFEDISGYSAAPKWDPTTGLGSPKGIDFVDDLLSSVSPIDGLIGIIESGPPSSPIRSHSGRHRPH